MSGFRDSATLGLLLIAVFVAFVPALGGGFVWDDDAYVGTNPLVRAALFSNPGKILTTAVLGNYHPLTILSFALEFRLAGQSPALYHVTNVLLHLLNVALVWYLVRRLSAHAAAAWVAALLFGLHPLRVESVAWISARKDVLYTSFYLISLIFYLRHTGKKPWSRFYFISLGAFFLSSMAKGMAVTLTLVLPLLDYIRGRKPTRSTVLEKVPFLALSLVFGFLAIWIQQQSGATIQDASRPLFERLHFAGSALTFYLGKLVLPLNLSAIYPYPEQSGGGLPPAWLTSTLLFGIAALVALSVRATRTVLFGALFFLFNIIPVLQVLPVGGAIAADRYTYVASIGLAYVAGEGYALLCRRRGPRVMATAVVLIACLALAAGTWQRCKVWHDPLTLFGDVIDKHPRYHPAYDIRGNERSKRGDHAGAMEDFDEALRLAPDFARAYNSRGNSRADLGDRQGALRDFDRAIELDPGFAIAHYNRGHLIGEMGRVREAIEAMSRAIQYDPNLAPAYLSRADARVWSGDYDRAIEDYDAALRLAPQSAAMCYYLRAEAYGRKGDFVRALADLEQARRLGHPVDERSLERLREKAGP